jgi:hypothetical protein
MKTGTFLCSLLTLAFICMAAPTDKAHAADRMFVQADLASLVMTFVNVPQHPKRLHSPAPTTATSVLRTGQGQTSHCVHHDHLLWRATPLPAQGQIFATQILPAPPAGGFLQISPPSTLSSASPAVTDAEKRDAVAGS